MIRISIVIPAYNVDKYIVECVDSVLGQTKFPAEIIIVDDGSTDQTAQLLERYDGETAIRVYHTRNRGLGLARNYGLRRASGEYVYFLDSDDILAKNFIENIEKIILANNYPDIVFFSGQSFQEQDCLCSSLPKYERNITGFFERKDSYVREMYREKSFYSSACLYIAKKKLYENNNLKFRKIIYEDEEIIFPLTCLAETVYIDDKIYFYRRIRANSIMRSKQTEINVKSCIFIIKSLVHYHNKFKYYKYYDSYFCRRRVYRFIKAYIGKSLCANNIIDFKFVVKSLWFMVFLKCKF